MRVYEDPRPQPAAESARQVLDAIAAVFNVAPLEVETAVSAMTREAIPGELLVQDDLTRLRWVRKALKTPEGDNVTDYARHLMDVSHG